MIRFALFGAGFIGQVHGANIAIHPRSRLAYVYDVNIAAAESLAGRFGATVAPSVEAVWDADDVDAVLIASSTNTHADLLSQAICAGKPVYCEKPIDLDPARVRAVVQEAHDNPVPIMMGFSRRFDPNHRGLREVVRNGEVGVVEMLHMVTRAPQPPPLAYIKVSGGQFRDQTIHMFDLLCWITGEAPVEVYATGASMMDPAISEAGDVDTSMLILRMPSGALCHIDNSRHTGYGYDERIEVFGSEGLVESKRKATRDVAIHKGNRQISDGLHPGWFERMEPSFMLALDAFVSSLKGTATEYPTLMDGMVAQSIADAAVESLHKNQPVRISYWQPA